MFLDSNAVMLETNCNNIAGKHFPDAIPHPHPPEPFTDLGLHQQECTFHLCNFNFYNGKGTETIGHSVVSQGAATFGITDLVSAEASRTSTPGLSSPVPHPVPLLALDTLAC